MKLPLKSAKTSNIFVRTNRKKFPFQCLVETAVENLKLSIYLEAKQYFYSLIYFDKHIITYLINWLIQTGSPFTHLFFFLQISTFKGIQSLENYLVIPKSLAA